MVNNNKSGLITGASGGIGAAFARELAADGFDLILSARSQEKLDSLAQELGAAYPQQKFSVIRADLSQPGAAAKLYQDVNKLADISVLINNAGVGASGATIANSEQTHIDMINLNVLSLTILAQLAARDMASRGTGAICNLASVAAFQPGPYMSVYFATKAYVLSFSQALAEELGASGVSVTTLCPGPTRSDFSAKAGTKGKNAFRDVASLPTAAAVASYGWSAVKAGKLVAVHGMKNKIITSLSRFVPRKLILKAVARLQQG